MLLVLVGFSCFWMSVDAGGERITLTITTLLAVYTQITQVRLSIPPTSYLTVCQDATLLDVGEHHYSYRTCAMESLAQLKTWGGSGRHAPFHDFPNEFAVRNFENFR